MAFLLTCKPQFAIGPNGLGVGHQVDLARLGQFHHLFNAVQRAPEGVATVNEGYFFSNIGQEDRPVKGRISATGQQYFLIAVNFRIADHVGDTFIFIIGNAGDRGFARRKYA